MNIKKRMHGKEQTIDEFVESVAEIRENVDGMPGAHQGESNQGTTGATGMSGMKKCDLGMSPEIQTRELAKAYQ